MLIEVGLPVALFIIMVGIGLTLTAADFREEARQPRGLTVGVLAQLIAMPALGFALVALLDLSPVIAVGVVIAATVPGGTTSNLICYLARANVALSIVLTVAASIATVVTLPLLTELAIDWQGVSGEVSLPVLETIGRLVGIVLLPVLIGMVIRARRPDLAARGERLVSAFGAVVLAALIVAIAIDLGEEVPRFLREAGPAVVLLNVGGIAMGGLVGRLARLPRRDWLAIAMELGVKNSTLGILVGATLLGDFEYAVPSAVYGLLMFVSAFLLVGYGRKRLPAPPPTPVPAPEGPEV